MNLFFDTSALVKFFHEEGTEAVTDLILDRNNEVWILERKAGSGPMPLT